MKDIVDEFGLRARNGRGRTKCDNKEYLLHDEMKGGFIHYVFLNNQYRNTIKSATTYSDADANTDHNPVLVKIDVPSKKRTSPINS